MRPSRRAPLDLSIVIPAYNEAAMLRQTLPRITAALYAQTTPRCSWEIVVCDNHSTDGTAEVAAQLGARTVFEPVRQIARARNAGAAAAVGEWLLFIDADSYPLPTLMADVFDVMEDGRYLGCGSTVIVEGGTLFNKLRMERLNPCFVCSTWPAALSSCAGPTRFRQ